MLNNIVLKISLGLFCIDLCVSQTPTGNTTGDVTLTTSHATIHAPFTKDLDLNCSFVKLPGSEFNNLISLIISKTATPKNSSFVEIATVTIATPDQVVVKNALGATVAGEITTGGSYISYKWTYPGTSAEGQYKCVATGMNTLGHIVTSTMTTIVEEQKIDTQMIIEKMKILEVAQDALVTKLNDTNMKLDLTKTELTNTKQHLGHVQMHLNNTKLDISLTDNSLNGTKIDLNQIVAETTLVKTDLGNAMYDVALLNSELNSTNARISSINSECMAVKTEFAKATAEMRTTNSELQETKTDLSNAVQDVGVVKMEMANVITELNKMQSKCANTERDLHQSNNDLNSTMTALNATHADLKATQTDLSSTKSDLSNTKQELAKTKTEVTAMKGMLNTAVSRMFLTSSPYGGHTYYISYDMLNMVPMFDAICELHGGYMVEINDQAEYNFVYNFIKTHNTNNRITMLGATDRGHDKVWKFLRSGGTMNFTKWSSGEPNGSDPSDCVYMNTNGLMYDVPCAGTNIVLFVCEIP